MMNFGGPLRPASYRGVRFYVRGDDKALVKAWQVDEYPRADHWRLTALGQRPVIYRVEAYVADDAAAEARADALEAALMAKGAGWLILPSHPPVEAVYHTGARMFARRELGILAFRLEFIARPEASGVAPGLIEAASLIGDLVGMIGEAAGSASRLVSDTAALAGAGLAPFEAAGFEQAAEARFAAMRHLAEGVGLAQDPDLTSTLRGAVDWPGYVAGAQALALHGGPALDALEQMAQPEIAA